MNKLQMQHYPVNDYMIYNIGSNKFLDHNVQYEST